MHWIYLSPHFDDVALSCGGLVWEQVQAGETISIWTVCAGKPPAGELSPFAQGLHTRWRTKKDATAQRRREDHASCQRLGASYRYFNIPDCIYRRHAQTHEYFYTSDAALNGPPHPDDTHFIALLQAKLKPLISDDMVLVGPLALGKHVDHQLTRLALEGLGCSSWYYQDYPYVRRDSAPLEQMAVEGWTSSVFPISTAGLAAWQDSIASHASQISTFWPGEDEMRQSIAEYMRQNAGIRLWRGPLAN